MKFTRPEFDDVVKHVAPSERGEAKVEHFEVSETDAKLFNAKLAWTPGSRFDMIAPGRYAKLYVAGELMMSDTPMERWTNQSFVSRANGDVFIAGLGLGLIVRAILKKPEVRSITVLEKSADVVALVAPTLPVVKRRPVEVITADVFDWQIPKRRKWDVIYIDIWPEVTEDNLGEYARVVRRFSPRLNRANPYAWMNGWRIEELRSERDAERRRGAIW